LKRHSASHQRGSNTATRSPGRRGSTPRFNSEGSPGC
jgi:hypothetical protein